MKQSKDLSFQRITTNRFKLDGETLTLAQLVHILISEYGVPMEEVSDAIHELDSHISAEKAYFGALNKCFLFVA